MKIESFENRVLREEDNGSAEVGESNNSASALGFSPSESGDSVDEPVGGDAGESVAETNDGGASQGGEAAPVQSESSGVSHKDALEFAKEAMRLGQAAQQPTGQVEAKPELTQDEINTMLKVNTLNIDDVTKFFNTELPMEERMAVLQQMLDKNAAHATTVANYNQQFAAQDLRKEFQPALQQTRSQIADSFSKGVIGGFPGLRGKETMVNGIIDQMHKEGWKPTPNTDEKMSQEAMVEVAQRATTLGRSFDPSFDVTKAIESISSESKPAMSPAALAGTGQGGGGGQASAPTGEQKPAWQHAMGGTK